MEGSEEDKFNFKRPKIAANMIKSTCVAMSCGNTSGAGVSLHVFPHKNLTSVKDGSSKSVDPGPAGLGPVHRSGCAANIFHWIALTVTSPECNWKVLAQGVD